MSAVILRFDDRGRSRITPPVLPAYKHPNGIHALVWCRFCQRYHWHGYGAGHRVAHCGSRGGPYMTSGYVLFNAGPAPAEMLYDANLDEPYGPYYRRGLW
jgi:hypothetical protein